MKYVKEGVNMLTLLTGIFGGYLFDIVPPENGFVFIAGLSFLTGLLLYFIVRGVVGTLPKTKVVRIIGAIVGIILTVLFVLFGFKYYDLHEELVFYHGDNQFVGCSIIEGTLTQETEQELESGRFQSPEEKVNVVSTDYIHMVWKQDKLTECRKSLIMSYFLMVTVFFSSVFILTFILLP